MTMITRSRHREPGGGGERGRLTAGLLLHELPLAVDDTQDE